jgi:hypothetical protein
MDQLVEVKIINNEVEKEDNNTCPDGGMIELDDKEKNMMPKTPCPEDVLIDEEEEGIKLVTPKT